MKLFVGRVVRITQDSACVLDLGTALNWSRADVLVQVDAVFVIFGVMV